MSALYVTLVLTVAAAFVGMLWLRREATKHWRAHQQRQQMRQGLVRLQIQIRDNLTPALQRAAKSIADLAPAMQRLGEAMEKARRDDA